MVQQTLDSKFSEFGLLNPENNSPACDKQCSVGAKKTPLRDLQNQNRIVPNSKGSSPVSKDREPCVDPIKVSGTKRVSPECALSPSQCQSPSNTAANRHLVYVRRKCEAELGKSSAFDCISTSNCQQMRQVTVTQPGEINQLKSLIEDSKVSCFPEYAPLPMASLTSSSAKPSVPLPLGKSATKLTPLESNQHPVAAASPLFNSPKGIRNLHWEERYYQLQMLLKKLDQSDQEDFTQMLRCISAVELSRHAVELEKRSIQLSLDEGNPTRVAACRHFKCPWKNYEDGYGTLYSNRSVMQMKGNCVTCKAVRVVKVVTRPWRVNARTCTKMVTAPFTETDQSS